MSEVYLLCRKVKMCSLKKCAEEGLEWEETKLISLKGRSIKVNCEEYGIFWSLYLSPQDLFFR